MILQIVSVAGARAELHLADAVDRGDFDAVLVAVVELFGRGLPATGIGNRPGLRAAQEGAMAGIIDRLKRGGLKTVFR